jgi:type IV pilus assembly protein PilM
MQIFSKNVVGIEFNDYSAQVVELKSFRGEIYLEAYNRVLIPPQTISNGEILKPEDLSKILGDLLKNANPHPITSKDIAVIFPSTKLFTHIFTFPDGLNEEEISHSLPYEAEKVIPFSINDVYWDFCVLPEKTKVLFVAITKQTADKYVNFFHSMELNPFLFGTDVETLQYGLQKQVLHTKNCLILDIGTLSSNYLVVKNRNIKHFFSSSKGGKHLVSSLSEEFKIPENTILLEKEKEKLNKNYLPKITQFIENNYDFANEIVVEHKINDIYLTGEFLNLPGFYEIAKKYFPKQNVFIGDPRKSINININKFKALNNKDNSAYYSTYFTNSLGIAMQGLQKKRQKSVNILPDALKENVKNKKRNLLLIFSSIFMSAILLFLATFTFFKHQDSLYERKFLEIQKTSIDRILYGTRYQEILTAINGFNKEVSEIYDIESKFFNTPKFLSKVEALLSDGITLNRLSFVDSELTLEISGIARTREDLHEIVQNFQNADFVSKVTTPLSIYDLRTDISFSMKIDLIFKELPHYGPNNNN